MFWDTVGAYFGFFNRKFPSNQQISPPILIQLDFFFFFPFEAGS